jgi:hypothetical protein
MVYVQFGMKLSLLPRHSSQVLLFYPRLRWNHRCKHTLLLRLCDSTVMQSFQGHVRSRLCFVV